MWILRDKNKNGVSWTDVVKPGKDDVEALKKEDRFHPIILDELLQPSERSRVEFYSHYLFMTYHLPVYDREMKTSRRIEIDFLVTNTKVISVHYEPLEPIETFKRILSNNPVFRKHALQNSLQLFYHFMEEILRFSAREMRHIEESVSYISQEIFKKRENEMLQKISYVKRDVLDYSIISEPQEIVLRSLADVGIRFWGERARVYLNDLVGDHAKTSRKLRNYIETIESLETTNAQLLSAKTNLVMQRFTILAFLTFPMFLFFSLLSVDFIGKFVLDSPPRFWTVFFLVVATIGSLAKVFRKKGWL